MSNSGMYLAEIVGTMLLVMFGDGVCANITVKTGARDGGNWNVIATAWALAVLMGAYSTAWISGAHLNPAVTIGLAINGGFSWSLVPGYIISQFIGGFLGAVFVFLAFKRQFDEAEVDADSLRGCFCTAPSVRDYKWNVLTEVIGTFLLVFGIFLLGLNTAQNGINAGVGPVFVAALVWAIGLSFGGATGYAINPARDLAPRIAHALLPIKNKGGNDWEYSWVPVVGPLIGAAVAALFYSYCAKVWGI